MLCNIIIFFSIIILIIVIYSFLFNNYIKNKDIEMSNYLEKIKNEIEIKQKKGLSLLKLIDESINETEEIRNDIFLKNEQINKKILYFKDEFDKRENTHLKYEEIIEIDNKIIYACKLYNNMVFNYNNKLKRFPNLLLKKIFKLKFKRQLKINSLT